MPRPQRIKVAARARPGVSPMISQIFRTCGLDGKVANLNVPHYTYYAPNAAIEDLGGLPFSPTHPFLVIHASYGTKNAIMIQLLDVAEKAAINVEFADLLETLFNARADRACCMDLNTINARLRNRLNAARQVISN